MTMKGDRVRLVYTADPYTNLEAGAEGTVALVDDVGTVHVKWDDGSRLGLIPGEDHWIRVMPPCAELEREKADLLVLLRRVEYVQPRWNGAPSCPLCGGYRHLEGHEDGCELAAAIGGAAE